MDPERSRPGRFLRGDRGVARRAESRIARAGRTSDVLPYTVALSDIAVLLVRTKGSPLAAEARLRTAVSGADGNLPIVRFGTPDNFTSRQQGEFVSGVLLGFGGGALVLASFGLFSVASYTIARRTREFGIQIALGAPPGAVLRSALQSTMLAVFAGLGVGLVLSVGLSSALSRWSIRNIDDPVVLAAAVSILLLSTGIATLVPARRATSIERSWRVQPRRQAGSFVPGISLNAALASGGVVSTRYGLHQRGIVMSGPWI
jgi:hypothetical protein